MIANPKNQQTPESQSLASIAFGISLEESLYPSHETLHEFLDQAPAPPPAIIINSSLLDPRNLLHGDERRPLNFPCKSIYTQGSSHGLVTRLTNSLPPLPPPSSYGNVPWTFDSPPRPFPVYSPVSRYVIPDRKTEQKRRRPMKVGLAGTCAEREGKKISRGVSKGCARLWWYLRRRGILGRKSSGALMWLHRCSKRLMLIG